MVRLFCVVCCLAVLSSAAESREWVDSTGKFRVQAELVVVRGDKVILERADGRIINLPISRLSKTDQAFLKANRAPTPPVKSRQPAKTEDPTPPAVVAKSTDNLASRSIGLLERYCARCHGEGGTDEGGFDFATNREKLVAAGYVHPRDPITSPLIARMLSSDDPMPPNGEGPRPTEQEIVTIKQWVREGAKTNVKQESRSFVGVQQINQMMLVDLNSLPRNDRQYIRYLSTTHLYNAGVSTEELATYQIALAKLLNSLSWNRKLAGLHPVGNGHHLFRIDLRDLGWTSDSWNLILGRYPYPLAAGTRESLLLQSMTGANVSVVRADWLVASASRPPLYHELLDLPSTDKRLESKLQVNVSQNIEQNRAVRLGFARSGVSTHNRLLERHESAFGAYWKSYDFASSVGRKNLFQHPMGPGITGDTFRHDGGEIIFQLPNGMLAFMLTDGVGRRIDQGPIDIVSDPRQPDRTVVNGVSCMSCHYGGFIQKSDEIRRHVIANRTAYRNSEKILSLYPDERVARRWLEQDTSDFLSVLKQKEIGIEHPTSSGEPIVLIANRFRSELGLVQVSSELGIEPKSFLDRIAKVRDPGIRRAIGALKVPTAVVKRETFEGMFPDLVVALNLGQIPQGVGTRLSDSRVTQSAQVSRPRTTRTKVDSLATMNVPAGAMDAFNAGKKAMGRGDWQTANDEFAIALRHSRDDAFTARVYEQMIPLLERGESVESLLTAHKYLLDSCSQSAEMDQANTNLYNSLIRFSHKGAGLWFRSENPKDIQWRRGKLPTTVTNALVELFERELKETPDHEPSLRVMKTYWKHVRHDGGKLLEVLTKLDRILSERDEQLVGMDRFDYASLLYLQGDAAKAATLYAQISKDSTGAASGQFCLKEAQAWAKAGQGKKGIDPLKRAQRIYERGGVNAVNDLETVGDAFIAIDEYFLAATAYRSALRKCDSPGQIETLQKKVNEALAKSPSSGTESNLATASAGSDELMDPLRRFRVAAEGYEKSGARNRSSAFYSRLQAAENWLKAKESEEVIRVLAKARIDLKRKPNGGNDYEHAQIAKIYQAVAQFDESLSHWVEAIKRCKNAHSISGYQASANAVVLESPATEITVEMKPFLDERYPHRVQAMTAESNVSSQPSSRATNLVRSAKYWAEAEAWGEVDRVGKMAEKMIKQIPSRSSSHPGERLSVDLAETYCLAQRYQSAVDCYATAITLASQDDRAMQYNERIKQLCGDHGLTLPVIPAEAQKKLDPLNRYRVSALQKEQYAKKATSVGLKLSYWMMASKEWLKAEENEKAVAAADQHAALLLKKGSPKDYELKSVAVQYEKIGNKERAIKAYQRVLEITTSEYQKKKLLEKIQTLQ